jgi:hypothetical protein
MPVMYVSRALPGGVYHTASPLPYTYCEQMLVMFAGRRVAKQECRKAAYVVPFHRQNQLHALP